MTSRLRSERQTKDLNDAIAIAKRNSEFKYETTARIEIRPIKMKEEVTNYVYPTAIKF